MKLSNHIIIAMFAVSIGIGIAGIHGTRMLMTREFASTSEGEAILSINVELASNLLAFVFVLLFFVWQQRQEHHATQESTERKLNRVAVQIGQLLDTAGELEANPVRPKQLIWKTSAWIASEHHFEEHLTAQDNGLFYLLEDFFLAAAALTEADRYRAQHLWDGKEPEVANVMVAPHIANLRASATPLIDALKQREIYVTRARKLGISMPR